MFGSAPRSSSSRASFSCPPVAATTGPMIAIDNVSKWYGDFQVLADCSTQVARGDELVGSGPVGIVWPALALVAFLYGPKSSVLSTLFLSLWTAGELERASVVGIVTTAIVLTIVLLVRRVTNTGLANSH